MKLKPRELVREAQSKPVAEPQPGCRSSDPSPGLIHISHTFNERQYYCLESYGPFSSGCVDGILVMMININYLYSSKMVTI